ncbi:peptidoglycan hydrolase-like protein with peptidoglycan-binding domain [Evansella vedderi]|uniref:Peptidoglycan hydrolase-like protein with peptidoglycan-binding domain n=1 Tax=Evansella vedderi TaxID=38282 RepID=A0ABT9ZVI0_9BACI|nr:L,D-transpeptidase family protein [Evansella vedderi]MDQ0254741.1 peptidoglycan hydrolase-like protein with peptidoglycan-binding domain [Evansella vedderi]
MIKRILLFSLVVCFLFTFLVPLSTMAADGQFIIINKTTNELAFYENEKLYRVFPVATGKSPELTPEGNFIIVNKIVNRPYYKENIPGGDPANPLGNRWLGLDARGTWGTTYAIHGNNNPSSIGTYASAGCIRMHNDDVKWLFDQVKENTPVIIVSSTKSFDSIAKANGYNVGEGESVKESTPVIKDSVLRLGSNSDKVKELKQVLKDLGYHIGEITKKFDKETDKAVRAFQKDYGLTIDGIVGPKTINILKNPPKKPSTPPAKVDQENKASKEKQTTLTTSLPSESKNQMSPEKIKEIHDNLRRLGFYRGDFDAFNGFSRPAKW